MGDGFGRADETLEPVRRAGDAGAAGFFQGEKSKDREAKREEYAALRSRRPAWLAALWYWMTILGLAIRLKPGVSVYGGFAGTETALEQRDWVAY